MSLFRSDLMGYYTLIGSWEYSWEILNALGEIDALQFVDLNSHEATFNRPFSNYVRRCEDLENKLSTLDGYLARFNVKATKCDEPRHFLNNLKITLSSRGKDERTYLDDVEGEINERIATLNDQVKNYEDLLENYDHLVEYRQVLQLTRPYVGSGGGSAIPESEMGGFKRDIQFTYLAGVIDKEDSLRFRRILFRITRGMTWTALIDMEKPASFLDRGNNVADNQKNEEKPKTAFIIVYQGGQHGMLKEKLRKVCESFGASQYGVPESSQAFERKLVEIEGQLKDAQEVVKNTKRHIDVILKDLTRPSKEEFSYSHMEGLRMFILKEKVLYHNLNMLAPQQALFKANCWCPLERVPEVEGCLQTLIRSKSGMGGFEFHETKPPGGVSPPTCFRTNEVTGLFQEIVNTYGVPRYREINPGLFTIATFPFLFGVMFGDVAHGGILFAFGIYLCLWKSKIEKDKESMLIGVLPVRYLLLLQGLMAFYAGFIYNDFTSIPLRILNSCYDAHGTGPQSKISADCTYEFGIDPSWYHTSNELTFLNSFKMKLSIILGVTQMIFGIFLRGANNIFNRAWIDFFFEFIPMLVFMSLTFGYMVFLIILKWSIPWSDAKDGNDYEISKAPSIIAVFIKMVLSPGKWDEKVTGVALYGDIHGSLQSSVQLYMLIICLSCALLILIPKPIILWIKSKKHAAPDHHHTNAADNSMNANLLENDADVDNVRLLDTPTPATPKKEEHHEAGGHHDIGEIVVHQVIETIEFVLGSISNTASYLRLWALSLAHSQLAKVFFDNTISGSIKSGNPISAFIGYWIFANVTLGVLILMDQMECFLHALRLHWVEFQSKFYKADGYLFVPFSFEKALKDGKAE